MSAIYEGENAAPRFTFLPMQPNPWERFALGCALAFPAAAVVVLIAAIVAIETGWL